MVHLVRTALMLTKVLMLGIKQRFNANPALKLLPCVEIKIVKKEKNHLISSNTVPVAGISRWAKLQLASMHFYRK